MKKTLIALICLPLLNACVIHIHDDSNYQKRQQTLELAATELGTLIANTEAGNLIIIGEPGRNNIEVQASILYYDEEDIELSLERRGDSAVLNASSNFNSHRRNSPIINLTVLVPAAFALELDDSSGNIQILNLQGNLQITDGSGNINIEGGHNIGVDDGSGNIEITGASGSVNVKDGSGNIVVREVKGNLSIDDGSGNITAEFIDGNVEIDDGSGSIDINQVGAINILEAGSGGLSIRNINGNP